MGMPLYYYDVTQFFCACDGSNYSMANTISGVHKLFPKYQEQKLSMASTDSLARPLDWSLNGLFVVLISDQAKMV